MSNLSTVCPLKVMVIVRLLQMPLRQRCPLRNLTSTVSHLGRSALVLCCSGSTSSFPFSLSFPLICCDCCLSDFASLRNKACLSIFSLFWAHFFNFSKGDYVDCIVMAPSVVDNFDILGMFDNSLLASLLVLVSPGFVRPPELHKSHVRLTFWCDMQENYNTRAPIFGWGESIFPREQAPKDINILNKHKHDPLWRKQMIQTHSSHDLFLNVLTWI